MGRRSERRTASPLLRKKKKKKGRTRKRGERRREEGRREKKKGKEKRGGRKEEPGGEKKRKRSRQKKEKEGREKKKNKKKKKKKKKTRYRELTCKRSTTLVLVRLSRTIEVPCPMFQAIASIGDGAINAAPMRSGRECCAGIRCRLRTRGAMDALTAMTKPMEDTPSIAQFLFKCPLTISQPQA